MAASSSSSSSSSCGRGDYDVFLSFRGPDTRMTFVCHLYKALGQKPFTTFIDTVGLKTGDDLLVLLKVIDQSKLSVVVLSQNYASSYWCLTELAKIVECMNTKKQIVVPIFYHVDPADVRHQRNSFMVAFAKHQLKSRVSMEEQQRWKSALTLVANVKGWESQKFQDDAELIDCIVEDVIEKLTKIGSSKSNDLVGMDAHIKKMESLMEFELNEVRTVGIWGMGGIGKTTIARAVYDKWSRKFEACCFLENVSENFKRSKVKMQEKLLLRILGDKVRNLGTLNAGSEKILEMLGKENFFVVLDDVDSLDQVEALLGKRRSFGDGSKIIITTRDRSLLSESRMYEPDFMEEKEALKLFEMYAKPSTQYDHLLRSALNYAQGLPLALLVLGASLHNKSICEWQDEFEKIKKFPNKGIGAVLRTSYEGLDDPQKKIFLDVACFFRGIQKDYATIILDACGLYPISGLRVLLDRALITTSGYYEVLGMHDLLQDMAFEIVHQELKPSRLRVFDEIKDVFDLNTDPEAVESIDLDLYEKDVVINAEAFVSMKKLRLLRIHYNRSIDTVDDYYCSREELYHLSDEYKQEVKGQLKFLSDELRCLIWHGYPLKSLPSNFHPKYLVDLDMRCSHIVQLWEGTKPLEKLKCINLSRSPDLIETPDLTKATNLEKVNLEGCISLLEVHSSISDLKNLIFLSLKGCKELKILPSSFRMKSLETLELSGCLKLENFPEIPEVMKELPCLCLDKTSIKKLPSSISNLTGLVTLSLKDCRELESLPSSICRLKSLSYVTLSGCSKFEVFPKIAGVEDMEGLSELHLDGTSIKELFFPSSLALKILSLSECKELKSLPSSIYMPFLKTLILSGCSKLQKFPEMSVKMEYLSELNLDDIGIEELPSSIKNLCQLKSLSLKDCGELKSLPSSIFQLDCLREIIVSGCLKFEVFPKIEEELNMDQTSTKMFSPLENLITLRLEDCKELRSLPSSICQLKSLRYFALSGCSKFEEFPEIFEDMEELTELHLNGTPIKELSPSIVRLKSLVLLNLRNCTSLVRLPDNFCNLSHLTGLTLSGCSNLYNLPNNFRNLQSLRDLEGEGSGIEPQDLNRSNEWEDDLKDRHPVQRELRTVFDDLHYSERNIFLDVAWFFEGMKKGYVTKVLYSCGFFPYSVFKVLLDSSLVAISARDGTLNIHNSLQKTVRDFVWKENEHEPGKRSRLHGHQAINCLSDQNTVTETVEVITLDLSNAKEVSFKAEAFVTMKKLRLLQILDNGSIHCKLHFSGDFKFISHELRCLIWHRYPLKSLPSNFHPKNLVDLDMRFSRLEQLWKGAKPLKNLAFINLSHSRDLKKIPDLTEAENLEKLNLEGCTSLSELHSSIFCLKNLDFLSLKGCRKLKILPSRINMQSLKTLDLSGCSNLKKFPEISEIMMELSDINLDETAIEKLPSSIELLKGLKSLSMRNCRRLVSLPDSICNLANLRQLYLDGCSKLSKFPVNLRNTQSFTISGTEELPLFIRKRETESEGVSEVLQGPGEESDGKEEKEAMEGGVSGMLKDLGVLNRSFRQLCRRVLKKERD